MSDKSHQRNLPVPFFSQREVRYIWQQREMINNQSVLMPNTEVALEGAICNIVSLAMLLHYYGITDDSPQEMLNKFFTIRFRNTGNSPNRHSRGLEDFPQFPARDFRHESRGYTRLQLWWILDQFPTLAYGVPRSYIKQRENVTIKNVEEQIKKGNPVMFSYGAVFLSEGEYYSGHIAVIRGFTEDDHVIINDPWGDVGTPDGHLIGFDFTRPATNTRYSGNHARFYNVGIGTSDNSNYSGLGNGDNSVLRRDELKTLIRRPNSILPYRFFQAIYIEYPHIWSFPFHQPVTGSPNGRTFRFSSHAIGLPSEQNVRQNEFREEQVEAMLESEVTENAGYPISANRLWHDGIHISGSGPVYAIGPGRLVAARIQSEDSLPATGSNNFILIRHQVKINRTIKEFYSHYMHLAPVDIPRRIREQLGGNAGEWERDWMDQLIERIKPKRAIARPGRQGETVQIFSLSEQGDMERDSFALPHNALIYLRPSNDRVRNMMENILPEDELEQDLSWFYNAVNNPASYEYTHSGSRYYGFYHRKTMTGNTVSWEIRYVQVSNLIHMQEVNLPEFIYYRRKLARLIMGMVTTFNKENNIRSGYTRIEAAELFRRSFQAEFPDVDFRTPLVNEAPNVSNSWQTSLDLDIVVNAVYGRILRHYQTIISSGQIEDAILYQEFLRLARRFHSFGRHLLSFPAGMLTAPRDAFTLNGRWFRPLLSHYRKILALFSESDREILPSENIDIEHYVYYITAALRSSVRATMDYHIEVNGNTKLGRPGSFENTDNIIHYEIFSGHSNLVTDSVDRWTYTADVNARQFVNVPESNERNEFFRTPVIIGNLREANFLNEPHHFSRPGTHTMRIIELRNFLSNRHIPENRSLQYAIVRHLYGHTEMPKDDWEQVFRRNLGLDNSWRVGRNLEEYIAYKWFSRSLVKELIPSGDQTKFLLKNKGEKGVFSFCYHPVRFLAWLDRYLIAAVHPNS